METIDILKGFESQIQARPCSRDDLISIRIQFETWLKSEREQAGLNGRPVNFCGARYEVMAIERIRTSIHRSLTEHQKFKMEIDNLKTLVARGYLQEATALAAGLLPRINSFSDLNVHFLKEAADRENRRHERWLIAALALIGGFVFLSALIELWRRNHH